MYRTSTQYKHTDNRDDAIEMVEEGRVSADHLLLCCLKWMSNDDVYNMLDANELSDRFKEDYDDNQLSERFFKDDG
mgnify:CR=1 FL=1